MFAKSVSEEKFTSFVQSLEQRLFFIEQKNYMLEQRINALQSENQTLHQALERRITDFTDVWHPMMMDNINRIKSELVSEVEKANNDKINIVEQEFANKTDKDRVELNSKLEELQLSAKSLDFMFGYVFIGKSNYQDIPLFVHKDLEFDDLILNCYGSSRMPSLILLDGLLKLQHFKKINIGLICQGGIQIVFEGSTKPTEHNFVLSPKSIAPNGMANFNAHKDKIKKQMVMLLEFCDKHNIVLTNGRETLINGTNVYDYIKQEWNL